MIAGKCAPPLPALHRRAGRFHLHFRSPLLIRSRWAWRPAIPTASSVVLWTRLAGLDAAVRCAGRSPSDESDEVHRRLGRPRRLSRSGRTRSTSSRKAWSLTAGTGIASPRATRRARSAARAPRPPPPRSAARLRFAFASCQHYEQGCFGAYRHIAADAPDLVAFLGDYIYESSWGRDHVRKHDAPRAVHARGLSRALRALQERPRPAGGARRLSLDRHLGRPRGRQRLRRRPVRKTAWTRSSSSRAAPPPTAPTTSTCRCPSACVRRARTCASTRTLDWGSLARFYMLDDRQYRSWQACPRPGRSGGSNTVDIDECDRALRARAQHARARAGALARRRARRFARQHGTCSRSRRRWRSSTRSPVPAGAPGPTAGTAIPPRASAFSILLCREKRTTRSCSAATCTRSTPTS